ncbi:hypothetical protein [Aestuariirhabdus sp. LZHN29]|uniref:hypothetical protein n=1 Tax=Aestuariirhabdus sp. LZHN29 TaxID=3417462 RepID=UPI003CE7C386
MLDKLERGLNSISDQNWSWWPLVFLRPQQEVPIDNRLLVKLTAVFGSLAGVLIVMLLVYYRVPLDAKRVIIALLVGLSVYVVIYRVSFFWAWNRRARRLARV